MLQGKKILIVEPREEKRYGVEFHEFEKNSSAITKHSILEKEDDFIEWEGILHSSKENSRIKNRNPNNL